MIAPSTAASRSASSKTRNGALPPSSSETFFTVPAHCAISSFPISVEPVKESLRTAGFEVSSPPITGASSASPVTTWSTPSGTPASRGEVGERQRGQRRLLGGLDDDRAAGGERRRGLAGDHRGGKVPGRDPGGDADRLLQDDDPLVGLVRRDRVAVDALRLLAEPLEERRRVGDLAARLRQRLALLAREQPCQLLLPLEHQVREPAQNRGALLGGAGTPGRIGPLGRLDRRPRLLDPVPRHVLEHLAGGGVRDCERLGGSDRRHR